MPKRRSGLSTPKRSMASCQVMRSMADGRSPTAASVASTTASVTASWTSSLGHERRLDVELGELELPVGAQVLVAQAPRHLEVAVDARHHEQLLGDLRALGQHVELAPVAAATARRTRAPLRGWASTAAASPPRRSPGAPWRPRMAPSTRAAQAQVPLHAGPAQVHEPVAQPHRLVDLGPVVDGERRRLGLGQDLDRAVGQLDLTRGQLGVDRALGARAAPCPRRRTTHSLRTSTAPSTTHWTMPAVVAQVEERRGAPRARAGAPPSRTASPGVPTCSGRSSPHRWVRIPVAASLVFFRPSLAAAPRSHSTTDARGTASWGPSWRSGRSRHDAAGELLGARR